jgi:enoyl-CoA hydratase/carnithine racemase
LTIHAAKTAIDACSAGQGETHLDALIALTERCMSSEDYEEGRAAFAEKRKPVFKGR